MTEIPRRNRIKWTRIRKERAIGRKIENGKLASGEQGRCLFVVKDQDTIWCAVALMEVGG